MTNYPLTWPAGWKRTAAADRQQARFSKKVWNRSTMNPGDGYYRTARVTIAEGTKRGLEQLQKMGMHQDDIVISTNLELRQDGLPRSNQKAPADQGVAVYWKKRKDAQHKVMAIDQYTTVADNLAAIAATLEAMRAIERHGGAVILERVFQGFQALPAPNTWRAVMGFAEDETPDFAVTVKARYHKLALQHHPDIKGGDDAKMQELNWAYGEAEKELIARL
ncbi:MAG: J domain-containing protein [Nitrospira sp.]|nr:MAG: J domain-containing protein [Nitrospira sp.]